MSKIAVFPGSFDPITKGHESIVLRALPLFDEVIVAIGVNSAKKYLFDLDKRVEMVEEVFKGEPKVKVDSFEGLTVDYCKSKDANYILRGLRTSADFEFERSIAMINKTMFDDLETIFILTTPELSAINSTIVRDIYRNGGDVSPFVPEGLKL